MPAPVINFPDLENRVSIIVNRFQHMTSVDMLFALCAVLLPPLAVFLKVGFTAHFFINVLLTILGIVPGQFHALWVVLFL